MAHIIENRNFCPQKFENKRKNLRPTKFYCIFILQSGTKQPLTQKKMKISLKIFFHRSPRGGYSSKHFSRGVVLAIPPCPPMDLSIVMFRI